MRGTAYDVLHLILTLVHREPAPEIVEGGLLGAVLAHSAVPICSLAGEFRARGCLDDFIISLALVPTVRRFEDRMRLRNQLVLRR